MLPGHLKSKMGKWGARASIVAGVISIFKASDLPKCILKLYVMPTEFYNSEGM